MSVSLWHVLSPGVNRPFEAQGGIFREEAIMLLRRFYVQENERGVCLNFSPFFFFVYNTPRTFPPFFFQAGCVCVWGGAGWDLNGLLIIYMSLLLCYMTLAPEPRPKKNRELNTNILPIIMKDSLDTVWKLVTERELFIAFKEIKETLFFQ